MTTTPTQTKINPNQFPPENVICKLLNIPELSPEQKKWLASVQGACNTLDENDPMFDPMSLQMTLVFASLMAQQATEAAVEKKSSAFIASHQMALVQMANNQVATMSKDVVSDLADYLDKKSFSKDMYKVVTGILLGIALVLFILYVYQHFF